MWLNISNINIPWISQFCAEYAWVTGRNAKWCSIKQSQVSFIQMVALEGSKMYKKNIILHKNLIIHL